MATGGQAVAATAGSVANFTLAGAFRAVGLAIKSIPGLGWLIAGVTAVGAAVSYFSNKAKEAKKEQEELSKAMIEGCYKPIGKIEELSTKYTMLGNNIKDKEKFIKDNKKSFEELGVSVKNVHDAENLLVRNKDAFVNAQMAKARAMAYMQTAAEQVKKQLELQAEIDAMSDTSSVYVQTSSYGTGYYVQGRNTAKDAKKKELAEKQAETRKLYENVFKEEKKAADEYKRARVKLIDAEGVTTPSKKPETAKNGGKDSFLEMLEKRKSEYDRYQKWQNSVNDEVKKASSEEFAKLAEGGKTYEEFLEKLHTKISTLAQSDKTSAQLRAIRNELAEVGKASVLEQFNESLKAEFDEAKNTLEQLRVIEEKRKELANDGTSIDNEKKKILDDAQKGVLQTQKEETATLLENYASYLDKKIKLDLEYNNDITLLEKARAKSTGRLLQDYQTFAQKEDAIATGYNIKRQKAAEALAVLEISLAKAKTDNEKEEIRKRIAANKEMVQEMNRAETKERLNIKFDQLKASPEYIRAFEDLDFASSETLQKLIAKFEEVKESAGENLNPEDVRQYMETIQTMVSELNSRDLFGALKRGYKDLRIAQEDIVESEQALRQIRAKGGAGTKAEEEAIARLNKAKDRYNRKNKEVRKTEIEVQKQVNNLCKSLVEIGGVIGGQAGEIVSIIGNIGSFVVNTIDSVKAVAATGAQAISSVEKASVILAVISAAYQIASKIIGMFTEDDGTAAYESAEKVYRSYIDTLHEVIDAELELMNTMTGKDAQAKYEHAIQLINKTAEAARNLGKQYLDSGASRGFFGIGSSASKGIEQSKGISPEAWHEAREVAKAHNISWETLAGGRMKGLFDLTSEQLKALKQEAPLFFAQLHEDTKKYINDILAADSTIKDTMAKFNESLVGVSFDTMRDDFRSSLEDMELDAKKISQNIQEYMRKALINDMFKKSYQGELQKYYDAFAQAMRADSDGGAAITEEEKKALNKLRESVVTGAVSAAEAINKQFEGIGGDADKSLTGAVKGVTEETASIVAGQLNAMRINQGEANNLLQQQLTTLSQIAANTVYNRHLEKLEGIWAIMSGSQNDPLRSKGLK